MPTLPPPPAIKLTPAEAAAISKRGRKLMRAGRITHCQWAVLDCLLWSCRSPATGAIVVSFSGLQKLANVSRATVSSAIQALENLRVLRRIKRRVRCLWHQGGQQSRQATNAYVLHPPRHSEFNSRTELIFSTFSSSRQPKVPRQWPRSLNDERSCRKDSSRQGAAGPAEPPDRPPGPRSRRRALMQGHRDEPRSEETGVLRTQPDYRSRRTVAHGQSWS